MVGETVEIATEKPNKSQRNRTGATEEQGRYSEVMGIVRPKGTYLERRGSSVPLHLAWRGEAGVRDSVSAAQARPSLGLTTA